MCDVLRVRGALRNCDVRKDIRNQRETRTSGMEFKGRLCPPKRISEKLRALSTFELGLWLVGAGRGDWTGCISFPCSSLG